MPNDLILKADAVKALEEYAFESSDKWGVMAAKTAFKCLSIVKNLPAFGETMHAKWINKNGYTACSNCGMLGYKPWKRCPVCEAKMDLEDA